MRVHKYNIVQLKEDRVEWDTVNLDALNENDKALFVSRKKAVDMYIDGYMMDDIEKVTNIARQNITRFIDKCVKINPVTSKPFGYTGLLKYKRIIKKINIERADTSSKVRGVFDRLLLKYPSLPMFVENKYFSGTKGFEKNITKSNLHKLFLEECKRLGIQDYEYPFNTQDKARKSLSKYIDKISVEKSSLYMNRESKDARQKFTSTGVADKVRCTPIAPYSTVQIDGHKIDALYVVEVKDKNGDIVYLPAMRMWIIAVVDVSTRAILGYSLTSEENYNQFDVLKAIKNSIVPKIPMKFTIGNFEYPDNYGYPSLAIKETEWAMIDTIMLDNAKSHLSQNVVDKLCNTLHCSLNFGSVATPETRGIVERVFKTLEDNGYHRLPSTTGSNVLDVKKESAEKNAVKYRITYNDLVQITEYLIAKYNNSLHSSLNNETPLQCMERRIKAGLVPYKANVIQREQICSLTYITEIKTIRGSEKNGKRPYITYKGVEYRNELLSQSMGLIGKKLLIEINPDNIRTLRAYFEDGSEFGLLTAVGEWGRKDHSLKTRQDIAKFSGINKQSNDAIYVPLTDYENELNQRALDDRRKRTKANRVREEQSRTLEQEQNQKADIISISSRKPVNNDDNTTTNATTEKSYTKEQLKQIFANKSLRGI